MNVIELFLPLDKGSGVSVEVERIEAIVKGLADRFGGVTAYTREPAEGMWRRPTTIERDRILVVEIVVREVDDTWWRDYRSRLEEELEQDQIMVRVTPCRLI